MCKTWRRRTVYSRVLRSSFMRTGIDLSQFSVAYTMPPYVPLVIKCQFPNQMSNDQFISQTFAQLEEARRKKSLASKRKQNHYQVGLFAPVEQWTVLYCNNSDSGGRSACSHRTDQEGLQSKGSFHKRGQLIVLLMVICRPKSSTQTSTPWQLRRRRSVSSIDLLLDQQLQEKMESKMKEIAAAHSCLSDPDK